MPPLPIVLAIGYQEILLVLLLIVLLFGAAKIPELARSFGKAKSEFEAGKRDGAREIEADAKLRKEARELGIDVEGKTSEDIRREVEAKRAGAR